MSRRRWLALVLGGLLVYGLAAVYVRSPGYMDADYYAANASEILHGHGLREPFLWNYLDDPTGLPHPSHLYWMPLTSLVAAAGMAALGAGFRGAQLPFIALAAALPAVTVAMSLRITRRPGLAWISGCLALFAGFYLPYFVTTDSFIIFAYTGGLALWLAAESTARQSPGLWLASGAAIGLSHLVRADGLLLLLPGLAAVAGARGRRGIGVVGLLLGYGVVMAGWWARTLVLTGAPLAPGVSRTLWLTGYDELFSYPASLLTPGHLFASGLDSIAGARAYALGVNLLTLIAVNGLVFLLPFALLGGWQLRHHPLVRVAAIYAGTLLVVMSLVFPFPGARGGTFHSSAALMPVVWALAPLGLERAVAWGAAKRNWPAQQAQRVFATAAVALAAALTLGLYFPKVIGPGPELARWDSSQRVLARAASELAALDARPGVVAVNNPPGFYLASGIPAVVIPDGDATTLRAVIDRFGVGWVILDANHPAGLASLYADPESMSWLELGASFRDEQGRQVWLLRVAAGQGDG